MPYPVRYSSRSYTEYVSILEYVAEKFGILKAAEVISPAPGTAGFVVFVGSRMPGPGGTGIPYSFGSVSGGG